MCCLGLPMRPRRRSVGALVRTTDLVHIKGNWREAELNAFILLYGPKYSPYWRNLPELCRCCRFCVARKRSETPGRGDPKFRWPAHRHNALLGILYSFNSGTQNVLAPTREQVTLSMPLHYSGVLVKKKMVVNREMIVDLRFHIACQCSCRAIISRHCQLQYEFSSESGRQSYCNR